MWKNIKNFRITQQALSRHVQRRFCMWEISSSVIKINRFCIGLWMVIKMDTLRHPEAKSHMLRSVNQVYHNESRICSSVFGGTKGVFCIMSCWNYVRPVPKPNDSFEGSNQQKCEQTWVHNFPSWQCLPSCSKTGQKVFGKQWRGSFTSPTLSSSPAPSNHYLFQSMQNHWTGKRFTSIENIKNRLNSFLPPNEKNSFDAKSIYYQKNRKKS